jgi:hypothetical protein
MKPKSRMITGVILVIVGMGIVVYGVSAIATGRVYSGRRYSKKFYTRSEEPQSYWFHVVLWNVGGGLCVVRGVSDVKKAKREANM